MDVPGQGPTKATVRYRVEDLDREKVGTYNRKQLMDNIGYKLEYDEIIHDHCFNNVIDLDLYSQVYS